MVRQHGPKGLSNDGLTARGYLSIEGKDPRSDGVLAFRISQRLVDRFMKYGPSHKFYDLHVARKRDIFEWRWELMDENNPGFPKNWKERFRRVLWSHSPIT
jgi:hypothetical protein